MTYEVLTSDLIIFKAIKNKVRDIQDESCVE